MGSGGDPAGRERGSAGVGALLGLALLGAWLGTAAGCRHRGAPPAGRVEGEVHLFAPERALVDGWRHVELEGATEWRIVGLEGETAIRARAEGTASGLIRQVAFPVPPCSVAEWRWRVDVLPAGADLRERSRDDVGAAVFFVFGDPLAGGLLPHPVPTLRYVWTSARHAPGEVIASPYLPDHVRNVVLRSGEDELGRWVREERNLAADFQRAFGHPPGNPVEGVALFSDADQTAGATEAYFGAGRVRCAGGR